MAAPGGAHQHAAALRGKRPEEAEARHGQLHLKDGQRLCDHVLALRRDRAAVHDAHSSLHLCQALRQEGRHCKRGQPRRVACQRLQLMHGAAAQGGLQVGVADARH